MAYKIFLDTNIVIDFFVRTRAGHKDAVAIMDMIEDEIHYGYISESVVNTTYYLVRKSVHAETFRLMMDEFVALTTILPCTNLSVHEAYKNKKADLEDAVLYQIAFKNRLDYFITSDTNDLKKIAHVSLPVVTAAHFLSIYQP